MTCEWVKLPDGTQAMVCGPRGGRRVKCSVRGCPETARYQCDAPLLFGTCDRYVCAQHRTAVRHGIDYCPEHG